MKKIDFLKDELSTILLQLFLFVFLAIYLYFIGVDTFAILFLLLCCFLVYAIFYCGRCYTKWNYLSELTSAFEGIEHKYLITDAVKAPDTFEGNIYFRLLQDATKNMKEEIAQQNRKNREYREYIEKWVHEIKIPITGAKLICENYPVQYKRRLLSQMDQIEAGIEQVLYYARMGNVFKDFFIKDTNLESIVYDSIAAKKQLLILNHLSVTVQKLDITVLTDGKWLSFLISQIMMNSIKHKKEADGAICFSAVEDDDYTYLTITDNGAGIPSGEINRIFDKGFTGSNGRKKNTSTGIGLYLCREICRELGILITAESQLGEYTKIILGFPNKGHLLQDFG